jgi:hypothetical protein
MAVASDLFARSHVARDSGALGHFCVCSTRVVGAADDAILLPRWAARLPSLDDLWEQADYGNALTEMLFR